jgi:RNA polymerase sigma factor (TIGR02999 family)
MPASGHIPVLLTKRKAGSNQIIWRTNSWVREGPYAGWLEVPCFQWFDFSWLQAYRWATWGREILREDTSDGIAEILATLRAGDQEALKSLVPLVYDELRRLARYHLSRERSDHTLQSTALVNEAYLRLAGQNLRIENRSHFFAIASRLMRQILVDHARRHRAGKRGSGAHTLTLDEHTGLPQTRSVDLVALDEALVGLAQLDAQQSRIVELRFFGGLSIDETSAVLGISTATVKRDWVMARAWLHREISGLAE